MASLSVLRGYYKEIKQSETHKEGDRPVEKKSIDYNELRQKPKVAMAQFKNQESQVYNQINGLN